MSEQVWYRFEGKKKDGSVLKLRIQDLPRDRVNDALELIVNHFIREESVNRAVGVVNNPIALENRKKHYEDCLYNPTCPAVICCSDESDDIQDIMGLSIMSLCTEKITSARLVTHYEAQELKNFSKIVDENMMTYNPLKEFNLDAYYLGKTLVVNPEYRGLGIPRHFLKARRIMCEAQGVPMIGSWMTAFGTQKAGARDGWETVKEIEYDYLTKKYDITFTNVPRTMKFMITRVANTNNTCSAKK